MLHSRIDHRSASQALILPAVPALKRPRLGYLYILSIPLVAGVATARGVQIAGFNYTGWLWLFYLLGGALLLGFDRAMHMPRRIEFPCRPWMIWFGFVWISLIWTEGLDRRHVQEAMQVSMPLLIGMIASLFVRTPAQVNTLMRAFRYSLLLLFLSVALSSSSELQNVDMATGLRPLGLTGALIGCVFLAQIPRHTATALAGWSACVLLSFVTGARTSTVGLIVLLFFCPLVKGIRARIILGAAFIGLSLAIFYTPQFQSRFFYSGSGSLTDVLEGNIRGSGRFDAWPWILEEAWRRPVLGHGIGTAFDFVPTVWPGMNHVHNDFLRVGFELGLVGLALFLSVFIWQTVALIHGVRRTTGAARFAYAAAFLGMLTYLMNAFTGNPLGYNIWVMNPLFALIGAAYGAAAEDRMRGIAPESGLYYESE